MLANDHIVDLIIAGFVKLNNVGIDSFNYRSSSTFVIEKKTASEVFLQDFNPQQCYVWRTLYRKQFLDDNKLRFIPGIYFEDVPFTTECLLKAEKCIKTTLTFYIYRQRENSIVSSISSIKIRNLNSVIARLWEIKQKFELSQGQTEQLMNTIFVTFSLVVWYISHDNSLFKERKELASDLHRKVPDLYFGNGIKQKIVSTIYRHFPCEYICLRRWFHKMWRFIHTSKNNVKVYSYSA